MNSEVQPFLINRLGLLPCKKIEIFGCDEIVEMITELDSIEDKEKTIEEDIIRTLEQEIALLEVEEKRFALINIKRRVFNNKRIEKSSVCSKETNELIELLNQTKTDFSYQTELIEKKWDKIHQTEREKIYSEIKIDNHYMNYAYKFISESIYPKVQSYLTTPYYEHNRKKRKTDSTISKLLTRATTKTSPFSTLTSTGFEKIDLVKQRDIYEIKPIHSTRKMISRLNDVIIYRIFAKVIGWDAVIKIGSYKLIPTVIRNEEYTFWTVNVDDKRDETKTWNFVILNK